ncbi:hypothetical protein BDQ17DRAFT_1411403, partial [Cyathus striatus]
MRGSLHSSIFAQASGYSQALEICIGRIYRTHYNGTGVGEMYPLAAGSVLPDAGYTKGCKWLKHIILLETEITLHRWIQLAKTCMLDSLAIEPLAAVGVPAFGSLATFLFQDLYLLLSSALYYEKIDPYAANRPNYPINFEFVKHKISSGTFRTVAWFTLVPTSSEDDKSYIAP